jgi:hypothetical protein
MDVWTSVGLGFSLIAAVLIIVYFLQETCVCCGAPDPNDPDSDLRPVRRIRNAASDPKHRSRNDPDDAVFEEVKVDEIKEGQAGHHGLVQPQDMMNSSGRNAAADDNSHDNKGMSLGGVGGGDAGQRNNITNDDDAGRQENEGFVRLSFGSTPIPAKRQFKYPGKLQLNEQQQQQHGEISIILQGHDLGHGGEKGKL